MSEIPEIEKGDIRDIIAKILLTIIESPPGKRNTFHFEEGPLTTYIDKIDKRLKVFIPSNEDKTN